MAPLTKEQISDMKEDLAAYLKKKNEFDLILSMIQDSEYGKKYIYSDNEVCLSVDPSYHDKIVKKEFTADICFINKVDNAVILVEETEAPLEKEDQILAYCCVNDKGVQTILKSDSFPDIDIFLIVPNDERKNAQTLFDTVAKNDVIKNRIGGRIGLTIWYYNKEQNKATLICGKHRSPFLTGLALGTISITNENRIPIIKIAPSIEILRFLYSNLISMEMGQDTPHFTKEKIKKILGPYGIQKEKKWSDALKLGEEISLLENVNLTTFYAEPKYIKDHQTSIRYGAAFINNPIEYMLAQIDQSQASIFDFTDEESEGENEDDARY
jgi:hypothetical protein